MVGNKRERGIKNDSQIFALGLGTWSDTGISGARKSPGKKLMKIYTQIKMLGGGFWGRYLGLLLIRAYENSRISWEKI